MNICTDKEHFIAKFRVTDDTKQILEGQSVLSVHVW